jgi:DNA invertase Pin-like site-specific DNA recombinase
VVEKIFRCAVYTRKSTEDGLEKEFNSLDAQYEACAAYALSQKHEGWHLLPERYDDGGYSGGNMERPGLKRLLSDVADGRVDTILVYKIDRLTRSLSDFAKIVDVLDTAKASFVSITQSFNTTTSMGRLTLNMLLSFAQFEREVTGERIRDKIAASKRKGMWMGGPVPLGYDLENRRLIPNPKEATLVRYILEQYLKHPSVQDLGNHLNAQGYTTKVQHRASGPHRGGCRFRRGTLYHLLSNQIYLGKIVHKGQVYDGEHEAIVSQDLFDAVQAKLKENASGSSRRLKAQHPSLLTGLLFDSEQRPMTPAHATKGKTTRYRYYITRTHKADTKPIWRVNAHDIEQLTTDRLVAYLNSPAEIAKLAGADVEATTLQNALAQADLTAAMLRSGAVNSKYELIQRLAERITLYADHIVVRLRPGRLASLLGLPASDEQVPVALMLPAKRARKGHQVRLVIPGEEEAERPALPKRNEKAIFQLAEAFEARRLVIENPTLSLAAIAKAHGRCHKHLTKLLERSFVAPEDLVAIFAVR